MFKKNHIKNWKDVSEEYHQCPKCKSPLIHLDTTIKKSSFFGKIKLKYSDYLCSKCNKVMRGFYDEK